MKVKKMLRFVLSLCIVTALFACVQVAYAEGAADLTANGGYRPYTERYSDPYAPRLSVMHVFLKAGETAYFGTSVSDAKLYNTDGGINTGHLFSNSAMGTDYSDAKLTGVNTGDIYVTEGNYADIAAAISAGRTPGKDGVTLIDLPARAGRTTPGYIYDSTQEAGGPDLTGSGTGYKVTSSNTIGSFADVKTNSNALTAASDGIYTVVFFSSSHTDDSPAMAAADDTTPFAKTQGGGCVASWDISVYNNGVLQSGRVFTDALLIDLGGNASANGVIAGALYSKMYAVTGDGYRYEVDFNGLDPSELAFTANRLGLIKAGGSSLLHSVLSGTDALSDLSGHGISADGSGNYELFFETPSEEALAALGITAPQAAAASGITDFKFTGTDDSTENQGFAGSGGTFSFTADSTVTATSYQIGLDFGAGNSVVLSNALAAGENSIVWDGRDADGSVVPAGTYKNVTLTLKNGEAHFPLLDVEQNPNGIRITRLNGSGTGTEKATVYYNNSASNAGAAVYPWTAANWTVGDKKDAAAGVDSSSSAALSGDGDKCAQDVWAIGSSASAGTCRFSLVNRTCTVRFDAEEHGVTPVEQTVSYGSEATQPAALTETGYTFGGWYKESGCMTPFDFAAPITADTKIYAKWMINAYTVKFRAETGGTIGGTTTDQSVNYGSRASNACTQTTSSTDYDFLGWSYNYTGADGQARTGVVPDYSTVPVYGDVTFTATYAKKPYVSITAMNGLVNIISGTTPSTGTPDSINASVDSGVTPLTLPAQAAMRCMPVNGNYELESAGITVVDLAGNKMTLEDGINTFTPAGATSSVTITVSLSNQTIVAANINDSLKFSVTFKPINTHYKVEHFRQNTDGSYPDDATDTDTNLDVDAGSEAVYTPITYAGCTYDAAKTTWEAKGKTASSAVLPVQPDGSLVIRLYYARKQYCLSFDINGHGTARDAQNVYYGANASEPEAQTVDGYSFDGWYENASCTGKAVDFSSWEMPDNAAVLYAKWMENTALITYVSADAKMGSVSSLSETVAASGRAAGSAAAAASGYHFVSWTDAGGTVVSTSAKLVPAKNSSGIYEDAVYTANFAADPVVPSGSSTTKITIPVSSGEGSVKAEATVTDDTAVLTVTDAQIAEIASGRSATGTIKVDASGLDVRAVAVPAKVIAAANGSESATGVEIDLQSGTVAFDKAAVAAVAAGGGDVTVSVEKVDNAKLTEAQKKILGPQAETALIVDVSVLAGGRQITDLGGGSIAVSVPYTPKENEDASALVVWFVKDDGGIEPETGSYNAETGKFEFQTSHLSRYALVSFPFKDVAAESWYYGSAAYAYMNGLLTGTSDAAFDPDETMSRAMLVTVLYRMEGSPAVTADSGFADVVSGEWYADAVAWAAADKLVTGYDNGLFGTDDPVTREQMVTILYRYAQLKKYDTTQSGTSIRDFADYGDISDYALTAMNWAVNSGLIKGADNELIPQSTATRAEAAAILQRFAQNIRDTSGAAD